MPGHNRLVLVCLLLAMVVGATLLGGSVNAALALKDKPKPENVQASTFTDNTSTAFPGNILNNAGAGTALAWGDYDNDSDLDLFLTGSDNSATFSELYRNDGNGVFARIRISAFPGGILPDFFSGAISWADVDDDGDLDLLLSGRGPGSGIEPSQFYRNNGNGTFALATSTAFPGSILPAVANAVQQFIDADNDGDLDLFMAGQGDLSDVAVLLVNNGSGVFSDGSADAFPLGVTGTAQGAVWGDFDKDRDLDLFYFGDNGFPNSIVALLINNGSGVFSDGTAAAFPNSILVAVDDGEVDRGDVDNDGDLDIIIVGSNSVDIGGKYNLYRNNGSGVFSDVTGASFPGNTLPIGEGRAVALADYDNDGDRDIMLAGQTGNGFTDPYVNIMYENNGSGVFADVTASAFPGGGMPTPPKPAWGDSDDDGNLDLLLAGPASSGFTVKLFSNNASSANTVPAAPGSLSSVVAPGGASVTLSWSAASDGQTAANGLSYNLRIGTVPGAQDIKTPMAASRGYRRVVETGPIQSLSWTLRDLAPNQTYFWSVQAIDSSFAGGLFAGEGQFTSSGPTATPIPGTATATRTATAQATATRTATPVGNTATPTVTPGGFYDVPSDNPFYAAIYCLAHAGIISGYSDGSFRPNNPVTRGQAAKIITGAAGFSDVISAGTQSFADVQSTNAFWVFVERAKNHSLISGYGCGGPDEPCDNANRPYFRWGNNLTRGQAAKIITEGAGFTDNIPAGTQSFADVSPSNTFWLFIERAKNHNLISGYTCGGSGELCDGANRSYFRWGNNVTRGQTAKIVAGAFLPGCTGIISRQQ